MTSLGYSQSRFHQSYLPVGRLLARVQPLRGSNGQRRTEITIEKARWENDKMITCVKLALTAQLICVSDHTFVCTDNGSLAQLIGVSACTGPDRSQPNDDPRRVPDPTRSSSPDEYDWK